MVCMYIYMYVYIHVCIYVCMCACMSVCIHTCTHMSLLNFLLIEIQFQYDSINVKVFLKSHTWRVFLFFLRVILQEFSCFF